MDTVKLTVFFDYTCPWVRQAGIWLKTVQDSMEGSLEIDWRCFLLEQVNATSQDWKAWEQSDGYVSRGVWPHRGGVAARAQGTSAHWRYALSLFEAKHVRREDVRSRDAVIGIAEKSDLDMSRFAADADSPDTMQRIIDDHTEAEGMEIFGTPTLIYEGSHPMFLKTFTPPESEAVTLFKEIMSLSARDYIGELKRPQPPWPRGVDV